MTAMALIANGKTWRYLSDYRLYVTLHNDTLLVILLDEDGSPITENEAVIEEGMCNLAFWDAAIEKARI